MTKTFSTTVTIAGLMLAAMMVSACSDESASSSNQGGNGGGAVEVAVLTMQPQSVDRTIELPGRVVARATAEIRPQVDGIVRKIDFEDGGTVEAGDLLYELEPDSFQAAYAAAQASYKEAQASVAGAQSTLDRNERLSKTSAVSEQTVEDARTALLEAQAAAEAAKANVDTAKINLDNTKITAPISGIIDISSVSVGSLVTDAQSTALATIRQIEPIYVDMVDTSNNMLKFREMVSSGQLSKPGETRPTVQVTLENGKVYDQIGTVSLADRSISESTGTFALRATVDNPHHLLLPGMFVRATVTLGKTDGAFLVPQRAVTRNAAGEPTAYFVGDDNKLELRVISTDDSVNNAWIVTDGIKAGDKLVVDGFQKISDGIEVKTVDATIDDNGVVQTSADDTANSDAAKTEASE